jgi:hypothetical protein
VNSVIILYLSWGLTRRCFLCWQHHENWTANAAQSNDLVLTTAESSQKKNAEDRDGMKDELAAQKEQITAHRDENVVQKELITKQREEMSIQKEQQIETQRNSREQEAYLWIRNPLFTN